MKGVKPLQTRKIIKLALCFIAFFLPGTAVMADAEIICRLKSVGQRVFVLDKGIFSSNVLYKNKSGNFVDWCPETDSQKLAFGRGTAICKFSGIRLGNKLAWGETVINFEKPSWERRYRFAKLGDSWKQSQPGGRENATCVHR